MIRFLYSGVVFMLVSAAFAGQAPDLLHGRSGVRALGMGSAHVALATGATAAHWNPAGVVMEKGVHINSGYTQLFGDVSRLNVDIAYSYQRDRNHTSRSALGLNLFQETVGDIPLSSTDADGFGVIDGRYTDVKMALNLSFAQQFNDMFSLGVNLKYFMHTHNTYMGSGLGLDLGVLCHLTPDLITGISIKNMIEPTIVWNTESQHQDNVPLDVVGGVGYRVLVGDNPLVIGMDYHSQEEALMMGVEYEVGSFIALRIGHNGEQATLGLGLHFYGLALDYAFYTQEDLGNTHLIALGF